MMVDSCVNSPASLDDGIGKNRPASPPPPPPAAPSFCETNSCCSSNSSTHSRSTCSTHSRSSSTSRGGILRNGKRNSKNMSSSSSSLKSMVRKSVHFPQNEEGRQLCTIVSASEALHELSLEVKSTLWFSRDDYQFSKSSARVIAKESERYGHSKHLDKVYGASSSSTTSSSSSSDLSSRDIQNRLNLWVMHGSSRRGLERWANSKHGKIREVDQYKYIKGMIRKQTDLRLRNTSSQQRERELCDLSCTLSQDSKCFAQRMGNADAEAAKWEYGLGTNAPPLSPRQLLLQHHSSTTTTSSSTTTNTNYKNGSTPSIASVSSLPFASAAAAAASSRFSPALSGRKNLRLSGAASTSTAFGPRSSFSRPARRTVDRRSLPNIQPNSLLVGGSANPHQRHGRRCVSTMTPTIAATTRSGLSILPTRVSPRIRPSATKSSTTTSSARVPRMA